MSTPVPGPVRAFPGAEALLRVHAASLPQPDQLAGPLVARLLVAALSSLPAPTVAAFAHAAGTRVRAGDDVSSRPPGAPADAAYLRGLPVAADDERVGTPVAGLGRAVEEFSGESLAAVPAAGDWTAARLTALLDAVTADGPVGVLAALRTGELVAAATPVADLDAGAGRGRTGRSRTSSRCGGAGTGRAGRCSPSPTPTRSSAHRTSGRGCTCSRPTGSRSRWATAAAWSWSGRTGAATR
ncbi:hypothetical protein WY02_02730 [Pseudonocardia sp. AL041005-10]|nr:hypothetical protein [Pseudonocardia sp. AL041005-10]ALE77541.1 hypothetical protein WY02_02730 [Pseudonocardia sp. AL041005-10]